MLSSIVLIDMRPPCHSNLSAHLVLLNVISKELASLRTDAERFPLVLKSFGVRSVKMFFGFQFNICACFSLIHVEIPAGPVLFNLANRHEIWLSFNTFQIFWILYIPLWWTAELGSVFAIVALFLASLLIFLVSSLHVIQDISLY